jgi:hypothetical protein
MAGGVGIEPTHDGVKVRCLTAWLSPKVGRPEGIEPSNAGATIRCVNHFATAAKKNGGADGIRTRDLLRDRQAC